MTAIPFDVTREMVRAILQSPRAFDWTVQGFGFIRTYFGGKRFRLNVWDGNLKFLPDVSTIHDHPWDFRSWIISGRFDNLRYKLGLGAVTHNWMILRTGVGGGPTEEGGQVRLIPQMVEHYNTGDTYRQGAREIHDSLYHDGTVTLNERDGDTERARVFWPADREWVDAMPRTATWLEVVRTTDYALHVMESST